MKRIRKLVLGFGVVSVLVLGGAHSAAADLVSDWRNCPAGTSLTTGTYTSGWAYHQQRWNTPWRTKYFSLTGYAWRYYNAGFNDAEFQLSGPSTVVWNTACHT